jgi:hypothetical protein
MRVGRAGDGVEIELEAELVEFLLRFPKMLDEIGQGAEDPAGERLNVPVYLDDPDANTEWWNFMGSELDASRQADRSAFREVLEASIDGTIASREEAHAMARVLNESRLAMAARIGVETESDYERLDPPAAAMLQALGEMQMAILWALGP